MMSETARKRRRRVLDMRYRQSAAAQILRAGVAELVCSPPGERPELAAWLPRWRNPGDPPLAAALAEAALQRERNSEQEEGEGDQWL